MRNIKNRVLSAILSLSTILPNFNIATAKFDDQSEETRAPHNEWYSPYYSAGSTKQTVAKILRFVVPAISAVGMGSLMAYTFFSSQKAERDHSLYNDLQAILSSVRNKEEFFYILDYIEKNNAAFANDCRSELQGLRSEVEQAEFFPWTVNQKLADLFTTYATKKSIPLESLSIDSICAYLKEFQEKLDAQRKEEERKKEEEKQKRKETFIENLKKAINDIQNKEELYTVLDVVEFYYEFCKEDRQEWKNKINTSDDVGAMCNQLLKEIEKRKIPHILSTMPNVYDDLIEFRKKAKEEQEKKEAEAKKKKKEEEDKRNAKIEALNTYEPDIIQYFETYLRYRIGSKKAYLTGAIAYIADRPYMPFAGFAKKLEGLKQDINSCEMSTELYNEFVKKIAEEFIKYLKEHIDEFDEYYFTGSWSLNVLYGYREHRYEEVLTTSADENHHDDFIEKFREQFNNATALQTFSGDDYLEKPIHWQDLKTLLENGDTPLAKNKDLFISLCAELRWLDIIGIFQYNSEKSSTSTAVLDMVYNVFIKAYSLKTTPSYSDNPTYTSKLNCLKDFLTKDNRSAEAPKISDDQIRQLKEILYAFNSVNDYDTSEYYDSNMRALENISARLSQIEEFKGNRTLEVIVESMREIFIPLRMQHLKQKRLPETPESKAKKVAELRSKLSFADRSLAARYTIIDKVRQDMYICEDTVERKKVTLKLMDFLKASPDYRDGVERYNEFIGDLRPLDSSSFAKIESDQLIDIKITGQRNRSGYIMEYVDGGRDYLSAAQSLSKEQLLNVCRQFARGFEALTAIEKGLYCTDLEHSCDDVMIDKEGNVKIIGCDHTKKYLLRVKGGVRPGKESSRAKNMTNALMHIATVLYATDKNLFNKFTEGLGSIAFEFKSYDNGVTRLVPREHQKLPSFEELHKVLDEIGAPKL